jgi:hypothetical protein
MLMCCDSNNIGIESIFSFLKENKYTGVKLKLLLFWGRHPQARFNLECIAHVLDTTNHHLDEILKEFIEKGVIKKQYCNDGIAHYSLNHDHALSAHITELAKLDWSAIKNIEGELIKEALPA